MKLKLLSIAISAVVLAGCGSSGESNSAPTFSQAQYSVFLNEDASASLLVNASDKDNDSLTYSLANAASNGSVSVSASSGEVIYTPDTNFNGEDFFAITVSDGEDTATTTVSATVAAINDFPVITMDKVQVSGGEVKVGQVSASDVDGDTLTYSITKQPFNGELVIDAQSGELTYTPSTLTNAIDSFELTVNDGNNGVVAKTLEIATNLATNADRAYYYYASEQSHLKRSEVLAVNIENDINLGGVYTALATGYAEAGLDNEVERFITADSIIRDDLRAVALVNVANQYNLQGKLERANELRLEASNLYSQYIAAKGISAFAVEDQDFFYELADSYLNAGEPALALQSYNVLDILLSSALKAEQTTQALRLFFGFRNSVDEVIATWQTSREQADFDYALSMADRLYEFANMIGYRYVSNDRNGNEGKPYFSTRQVALGDVVENYRLLGQLDKAKSALADALALHGVVNYDEAYTREKDEYADVTMVEYPFGLINFAESFVNLYPNLDLETSFLTPFEQGSTYYDWAKEDAEDARLFAYVRNIEDADESLALILAAKDDSDLRRLFTNIIAFNSSNPGGSRILIDQGRYAGAAKYITEGLKLLSSEQYIAQNIGEQVFVTGTTGCQLLLEQLFEVIRLTGEQSYREQANKTLTTCREISLNNYAQVNGTEVTKEDVVASSVDLIKYHNPLGQNEAATPLIEVAKSFLATYGEEDLARKVSDTGQLAAAFGKGGQFELANQYYSDYANLIKQVEEAVTVDSQFAVTQDFFDASSRSTYNFSQYYRTLKSQAGRINNYQQLISDATAIWVDLINWNINRLDEASLQLQLQYYPEFANQYLMLGQFDAALALKDKAALGVVEHDSIVTDVINYLSQYDAFTRVTIATVDTDNDGKANFFAPYASDEMIAQSGIELDLDSDGDGVNDDADTYPLDETRQ